ncbi:hypothetical protein Krodi_1001 [Dokdonia sp. 4H-3-7-5]|nr:hypothetical protein Krodi_1001 [Dokdonia sp. 4H-3-7-5]
MFSKLFFKLFTISLLLFTSFLFAQNSNKSELIENYSSYFELPRQSAYIHLNKTHFTENEEIWFKAYLRTRQLEKSFSEKTTLYIDIFKPDGLLFKSEKFIVDNGVSHGNIKIDSTMQSGTYYLRGSTQWMKNFKEDDSFMQKITVVSNKMSGNNIEKEKAYDIQLLPEGGHLIHSTTNTVGVKVLDEDGFGASFKNATIRNQNGIDLLQIKSKSYGFAKFNIIPVPTQTYTAHFTFEDNTEIAVPLPDVVNTTPSIAIVDEDEGEISIKIKSNYQIRNNINRQGLYVLLHKNGVAKKIKTPLTQEANISAFVVNKSSLFSGMNIITLFDANDNPLSERLYFNWADELDFDVEVSSLINQKSDSITITLNNLGKNISKKNLSVSVLPTKTKGYDPENNILSSFYLKPYLQGSIENPKQYFNGNSDNKENLDLLLLTQGWSSYTWENINKSPPKKDFDFEQGTTVVGKLNRDIGLKDNIYVHPTLHNEGMTISPEDNMFALGGLYTKTNETISFSLINKKGQLSRPSLFVYEETNRVDPINITSTTTKQIPIRKPTKEEKIEVPQMIDQSLIELNEVILEFEQKKTEIIDNPNVPSYLKNKIKVVTEDDTILYPFVTDIIRQNGYVVLEELSFGSTSRVSISSRRISGFSGARAPLVYLDDVELLDLDILYGLRTDFIESYYINKFDPRSGSRGGDGVIRLYSRRNFNIDLPSTTNNKKIQNNIFTYAIREGYSVAKKFYNPVYTILNDKGFINYGTIHWEPEVILSKNKVSTFNIINTNTKSITLFIEGISEDGAVISKSEVLQLENTEN